jgi:biopolymer transport protein ExbD
MSRSSKTVQPGIYEPNLTALIDVSLVLVVILLVATPMALQSGIAVSHAAAAGKQGTAARTARIELIVRADGQVAVNERVVPRDELGTTLAELMPQSPTREVVVRCDEPVTHGAFVSVLDEAKAQGAARIAVLGQ